VFRRRNPAPPPRAEQADWRTFDSVADVYDRTRAPVHEPVARDLVAILDQPVDGGLLDVGTGTGVVAAAAQAGGWRPVVGLDRSLPMLAWARSREVSHLLCGSAIDLPFRDATFGAVASQFALHTFPKLETALFDMLRVLRPEGRLGAATWAGQDDEFTRTWRSMADAYATKEVLDGALRQAAPWQQRLSDRGQLEEALRSAGLRNVTIERREYRATVSQEDYLLGRETSAAGRFLRGMLGDALWERFRSEVREAFRSRFADPLGDTYETLIAVGIKSE
jgi:ubiquinone/menaquinone biosynthesis C-methylase UbiE